MDVSFSMFIALGPKCVLFNRAKKILSLRIFENPDNGKAWDKSITDLGLEVLCVSQV